MRIALVGMYGGMWREYNPGCYMIAVKTLDEMRRRLPRATFSVFSIDNRSELHGCFHENAYGLDIQFFSRSYQLSLLEDVLSRYDALIIGGGQGGI